jgi:hypothetical protein
VIFSIDHIVFAATPKQREELIDTLYGCGFAALPGNFHLDFPDTNAASDSVGFSGGSSLEFVYETSEPGGPALWFAEVPRVIGLGFSSDDFERDTDWEGDPGAWTMAEQQGFPNSAGPHEHHSDFYVFVMNRKGGSLQFPQLTDGPKLTKITLAGAGAGQWRERLARWLGLPANGPGLSVGQTALAFEDGPSPNVRATLTFAVAGDRVVLPLASGAIELVPAPTG